MAPTIPAAGRIEKARSLIQEARTLPVPAEGGRYNFSYVVQVKAKLKEARELVQLIPKRAGISRELADDAKQVLDEAAKADQEIFHPED